MRWAGARVAISCAMLMVLSACGDEPVAEPVSAENASATTGSTIDLFATTEPAPVVSTTEEPAASTTQVPASSSTSIDQPDITIADAIPTNVPPEFGPAGLLWIGYWGGYSEGLEDVRFVLAPDGSVLRIDEGDIFSGAGSYLTWNIGPAGYTAVVNLIDELSLASDWLDTYEQGQSGEIRTDGSFRVRIESLNGAEQDFTADQRRMRKNFHQFMAQLDDMSWLEGVTTVTPRAPWVPDQLALNIRDEYNTQYYSTDAFSWPFDESLSVMASGSGSDRWVCLEGEQAETAWNTFMLDGVNNARLPLEADGQLWEAGVRVSHPMYGGISPCPAATGFGTGSNERVEQRDVSELFLTAEDVGEGWTVSRPTITPPPPNLANCSPITDAEVAVDQFDSWLTYRSDIEVPGLISQFLMLGEVPAGVDSVAVMEQVGTYSCLEGLGQFGVVSIESGMLLQPPDGVSVAAVWELTFDDGGNQIVIDAVLDNDIALVLGMISHVPIELADLEPHFLLAVEKATAEQ